MAWSVGMLRRLQGRSVCKPTGTSLCLFFFFFLIAKPSLGTTVPPIPALFHHIMCHVLLYTVCIYCMYNGELSQRYNSTDAYKQVMVIKKICLYIHRFPSTSCPVCFISKPNFKVCFLFLTFKTCNLGAIPVSQLQSGIIQKACLFTIL